MLSGIDDYPMGTNAIVAVISYTGYDMEDAMIINKMSFERGFCAGMIYKEGHTVNLILFFFVQDVHCSVKHDRVFLVPC